MRIHIRRISPPSLSIVLGLIYGVVGLVIAILSAFGLLMPFGMGLPAENDGFFLLKILVIQPFLSVLWGVITGFLVAWLYNFVARFTKGILIEYAEAGRHDD